MQTIYTINDETRVRTIHATREHAEMWLTKGDFVKDEKCSQGTRWKGPGGQFRWLSSENLLGS